jgi:phosphoribosylamine--glycine ligase
MDKDGNTFSGVLYPGLMLTKDGPKILEYNARFGDPETETYMRLLETDLIEIIDACIDKKLDEIKIKWKSNFACTVMLASGGYPGAYEKGKIIKGIKEAEENKNVIVFHAGTKMENANLVTNGGRVLGVSATGESLEEALAIAYEAISKISFEGMQYRKDIGRAFKNFQ